jgi:hypothetical protein
VDPLLAKAGETAPLNIKLRISILIDLDVLNFFKERASKAGALAHETQINQKIARTYGGQRTVTLARSFEMIDSYVAKCVKHLSSKKRKST